MNDEHEPESGWKILGWLLVFCVVVPILACTVPAAIGWIIFGLGATLGL